MIANHIQPHPRFVAGSSLVQSSAALLRGRLSSIASTLAAELAKPAAELAAGRLTALGVTNLRRQAAARVLPSLDAERSTLTALEAEVAAGRESQQRFVAEAEARLPASTLARAQATAALFNAKGEGDGAARDRFVRDLDNGVQDAVLGGLFLSPYGVMADVHTRARAKFAASIIPIEKQQQLRAFEIVVRLVRLELEDLRAAVAAIAKTGEDAPMTAAQLMAKANDNDRSSLTTEGIELGVFLPPSASTGDRSPQGDRVPAVVAGEASNRNIVSTGGR